MSYRTAELITVNEDEYCNFIKKSQKLAMYSPDISMLRDDALLNEVAIAANQLFAQKLQR